MKIRGFAVLPATIALICMIGASVRADSPTAFQTFSTPTAPTLAVTTSGTAITLSWTTVPGATGYTLYYAPSPYTGPDSIQSLDMGNRTDVWANLWDGAAFYVAVEAYDATGGSGYSNIQHFTVKSILNRLPDTGQTQCYDDATEISCPQSGQDFHGQDANYIINPPSYSKLDAGGKALPDTAASWVMVQDNVTGLVWEVKTDDSSVHDKDDIYAWQGAQDTFIASLNASGFGSYTNWRLPTIKELGCIVNFGTYGPAINTDYFPNTMESGYWPSTPYAYAIDSAWIVDFYYGDGGFSLKSGSYHVRAVRSEQSDNSFVDNGDGTVTDTSTELMWQQITTGSKMTWKEALSHCESLTLAEHADWRLPNRKELQSIIAYGAYNPAIDSNFFPDTVSSGYWSSTTRGDNTDRAWSFHFGDGNDYGRKKTNSYYGRAVRGGQ